jgi:hypothetical protein
MTTPVLPVLPQQAAWLKKDMLSVEAYSWLDTVFNVLMPATQSGPTANRPTTRLWVGRVYFDTTLGYPVWVQSVNASTYVATWVNGAGTTV